MLEYNWYFLFGKNLTYFESLSLEGRALLSLLERFSGYAPTWSNERSEIDIAMPHLPENNRTNDTTIEITPRATTPPGPMRLPKTWDSNTDYVEQFKILTVPSVSMPALCFKSTLIHSGLLELLEHLDAPVSVWQILFQQVQWKGTMYPMNIMLLGKDWHQGWGNCKTLNHNVIDRCISMLILVRGMAERMTMSRGNVENLFDMISNSWALKHLLKVRLTRTEASLSSFFILNFTVTVSFNLK